MGQLEDDEESQRRGLVVLAYHLCRRENAVPDFDQGLQRKMAKLVDSLPVRMAGIHFCMNPHFLGVFKSLFVETMRRTLPIRLRVHAGTSTRKQVAVLKENRQLRFHFLL
jgi:hypothetical protein